MMSYGPMDNLLCQSHQGMRLAGVLVDWLCRFWVQRFVVQPCRATDSNRMLWQVVKILRDGWPKIVQETRWFRNSKTQDVSSEYHCDVSLYLMTNILFYISYPYFTSFFQTIPYPLSFRRGTRYHHLVTLGWAFRSQSRELVHERFLTELRSWILEHKVSWVELGGNWHLPGVPGCFFLGVEGGILEGVPSLVGG